MAPSGSPTPSTPIQPDTAGPVGDAGLGRLVVVYGGRSAEHDISCISARAVAVAATAVGFDVEPVAITRDGRWHRPHEVANLLATDPEALPSSLPSSIPTGGIPGAPHELLRPPGPAPVVVFPLVHGPMGEDGTLQGLCELLDVAYVGCGVLSSAMCMDKAMAKEVLAAAGIPQARHLALHATAVTTTDLPAVMAELGGAVFVKPANMGSSVGISMVTDPAEIAEAVELALGYDQWIVIEERITGREIECAVLGHNHDPQASLPGEAVAGTSFRSYADKYLDGKAQLTVPAELDDATTTAVRQLAVRTFRALRCEGMARVDFFLRPDGSLLVNEVNTIPGFTPFSMYPSMWGATGLPYPELVRKLAALAHACHRSRPQRTDVDP